jgi:hypothetical protein
VEKERLKGQDHCKDATEKAEHPDLEAGQVVFHIAEHLIEHQREPKHRKENAQGRHHPDLMSMLVKERLPFTYRDTGLPTKAVDHQRIQESNGKFSLIMC